MVITLTPEIEQALHELAKKQGTTVEFLALKTLRERLFTSKLQPVAKQSKKRPASNTLADFLTGYIAVLDSSEFGKDRGHMSKHTGKTFADILLEKRRRGRL
jgi:DNA-binding transcriptional ArsR family regulator